MRQDGRSHKASGTGKDDVDHSALGRVVSMEIGVEVVARSERREIIEHFGEHVA